MSKQHKSIDRERLKYTHIYTHTHTNGQTEEIIGRISRRRGMIYIYMDRECNTS